MKKGIFYRLMALLCCTLIVLTSSTTVSLAVISDQQVQTTKTRIIDDLRSKLLKLNYISRNYDSSTNNLCQAMESLVTLLDSMNYKYSDSVLGGTAHYPKTASPGDLGHNTIYVSDEFFSHDRFGAKVLATATDQEKADADKKLSISQAAVLLHEGVHADQNLQFKTLQVIGGLIPLPGLGDKAEGQAYLIEYLMLRSLGGENAWTESQNALLGIKGNWTDAYDLNKLNDLERFHKSLGMDGVLRLLDGGIDKAYDRLKQLESTLPAGKNTKLRYKFKLVDEQGRPVSYPVKVEAFNADPEPQVFFADINGEIKSDYLSWIDTLKTYTASNTYSGYLQYEGGKRVLLFKFTGEGLFKAGPLVKDKDDYYTIDLGSCSITGAKPKDKVENKDDQKTEQKPQPTLQLNIKGPGGKSIPIKQVSMGITTSRPLSDENELVLDRKDGYAGDGYQGKFFRKVSASFTDEDDSSVYATRSALSDGGAITVDFTPAPELPAYNDGWYKGMKDDEKISKFRAIVDKADALFQQAMESHGVVEGSGGTGYTLDEYYLGLYNVGEPNIYTFPSGNAYTEEPLKAMWKQMQQRQHQDAYAQLADTVSYANQCYKNKKQIEEAFSQNNFAIKMIQLRIDDNELTDGEYIYLFPSDMDQAAMRAEIDKTRTEYDAAIERLNTYLNGMGGFFNDPKLWKALASYEDLYRFLPKEMTLPKLDASFSEILDPYNYQVATYYQEPLGKSKDLMINAMEKSMNKVLAERGEQIEPDKPAVDDDTLPDNTPPENERGIGIMVNGQPVATDIQPVAIDGRTMVPLRTVAEALQCDVEWRGSDKTVIITGRGKAKVYVQPGSGELRVVVNGFEVNGDVPPIIIDGRTLVPVRLIAESLGAKVDWDMENRVVVIDTPVDEQPTVVQPPVTETPTTQTPVEQPVIHGVGQIWDEWTVRTTGNGLPVSQDVRQRGDSPWTIEGGIISYSNVGSGLYHNDYIITQQKFDLSNIEISFEAKGEFRSSQGYVGPTITFTLPENIYQTTQAAGAVGIGGWYSWEQGKADRGMLIYNGKNTQYYTEKFMDYGDDTYRQYTLRIRNGRLSLVTPEGTFEVDVPDTKGISMPLAIAFREYDKDRTYSLAIRNLRITEGPSMAADE
ncbi:MAG: copper amine oxidase N-terminal domain-containing protein [Firmicutes bacterium]|nr:copper amine oxidase N-terminal domain-containing protein [Bacillota bacterium]